MESNIGTDAVVCTRKEAVTRIKEWLKGVPVTSSLASVSAHQQAVHCAID